MRNGRSIDPSLAGRPTVSSNDAVAPAMVRPAGRAGRLERPLDSSPMPTFRAPRGTRDLLPTETATWTRLERLAADLAARYGYRRIETPLFELTDVFERGVGEVTDIVEKSCSGSHPGPTRARRGRCAPSRRQASCGPTSSTACRPGPSRSS